ncbi:hypothetical protein PLESTM_001078900 [Pleodorina starrii]|nr:hypothetical protein PLESTM_001078900 [Pleodorina starrii]
MDDMHRAFLPPGWLPAWSRRVAKSESARRSTHRVVDGFGLSLQREPWPLWAPLPVSCALLPLLVALLIAAWARERIQRRVAAGGLPFCDACPSESGSESGSYTPSTRRGMSPRAYFTAAGAAAVAAWLVQAWLVSLLACVAVWAATMQSIHSATKAVKPYSSTLAAAAAAATTVERLTHDASAAASNAITFSHGADGGEGWDRGGWGPGGFCPPSCVDLSAFSYYLGQETCCCNTIGGVFAAEPHSAAAAGSLTWALLGLGLLWAGVSWLLLAAGCQIAHTESETLLCFETTCAAAAAAAQRSETIGQQGQQQAAVQRLSSWLLQWMGGDGVDGGWASAWGGGGQGGPRGPLLGGSTP